MRSGGSAADWHYRNERDYLHMVERARAFDRNNMIVPQAVTRLINNVLQDGMKLDPQTGDDDLNAAINARWDAWSEDPEGRDAAGEHDFHSLSKMALRHTIVDGDILLLPLKDGRLEAIENHRLRTPSRTKKNVVLGVLRESTRLDRARRSHAGDLVPPPQGVARSAPHSGSKTPVGAPSLVLSSLLMQPRFHRQFHQAAYREHDVPLKATLSRRWSWWPRGIGNTA